MYTSCTQYLVNVPSVHDELLTFDWELNNASLVEELAETGAIQ